MSKRTLLLILAALLTGAPLLAGQAKPPAKPAPAKPAPAKAPPAPPATPTPGAGPIVVVETVKGTFEFETYPNEAPRTVEHVLNLVKKGFYNGIRFHRVEPGFVIQAGDLGLEAGQDCFGGPLDSALREGTRQRRDRIAQRDERPVRIQRHGIEVGSLHATHCHSAHWTTAMPRNSAPQATTALCKRGLVAVSDASARKSGKITSPKRGRESRGQRELG